MMKNILIGGPARSGKSTLANLLHEKGGYNVLRGDLIMSALISTHPEIGIDREPSSHEQAVSERTPYLFALLKILSEFDNVPYVLDSNWITPEVVDKMVGADDIYRIVFLGYPRIEHSRKLKLIRVHAVGKQCVSWQLSDRELAGWVRFWIEDSKKIKWKCEEYGYMFVDTGSHFKTAIESAFLTLIE